MHAMASRSVSLIPAVAMRWVGEYSQRVRRGARILRLLNVVLHVASQRVEWSRSVATVLTVARHSLDGSCGGQSRVNHCFTLLVSSCPMASNLSVLCPRFFVFFRQPLGVPCSMSCSSAASSTFLPRSSQNLSSWASASGSPTILRASCRRSVISAIVSGCVREVACFC